MIDAIFKNGKSLSQNSDEALKYLAKVGVMTKAVWLESFCRGGIRWKNRQLKILLDNGLLKKHNCDLGNYYVLGERGSSHAKKQNWKLVQSGSPSHFRHDELVGHSLFKLEKANVCRNWVIEKELKENGSSKFLIQDQGEQKKYPDAICEAYMAKSFHLVAFEYERTGKTIPRYRHILWSYNKMNRLSMVLFIVENELFKNRIKASLKHLGKVSLIEKIGFVVASEWQKNPLTATIELARVKTCFSKLSAI